MTPTGHKTRPRVLHFVTHLGLGGAERVAVDICRGLLRSHECAVFAVRGVEDSAVGHAMAATLHQSGVPVFSGCRVPLKAGGVLPASWRAGAAVAEFQPDVLHLHTEIPEATCATLFLLHPHLRRSRVVRTIHNSSYWHHWPRLGRWCERRLHHAHAVAVSRSAWSAYSAHRLASGFNPAGTAPEIILNGVEDLGEPQAPVSRTGSDTLRLLWAGRLEEQKGADLLPAIMQGLRHRGLQGTLDIFGSGTLDGLLRGWISRPLPGWTVTLHAPVGDLRALLPRYDLVLMPSRFEGLSLLAIETLLSGVTLVATSAPGLLEVLPAGYPWLAAVNDAENFAATVARAIGADAARRESARGGREFALQRFALKRMVAEYRALYERIVRIGT